MSTKIEFNVKDEDLKQVLDNNPFLINISGAVNMCMIRCGQEIDSCNSVKIETMTNYGNILVLNPSKNNDIKCNVKLPYDSVGDNNSNYKFNKIFFTVPSLHRINNTIYDMETFIVFSSKQKDGSVLELVLCTLLSGIDNVNSGDWKLLNFKLMNELFSEKNTVPEVYGTTAINLVPNPVDLNTFIPSIGNRSFYDYTHPKNVKTNVRVFQTPMSVSNNILSILKNKLSPGSIYNNNKNIIQKSINPSSGLFLYYSEDLTDRYKSFSVNKGFQYKEESTLNKKPVMHNVEKKNNTKNKNKNNKITKAKVKKAFSKKEINKDKAKVKKAFSKKEINKDKAAVKKALSKKEINKDKAVVKKAFSKKEINKDKAKINKAFKGKSKKEKFTNYNDSDNDVEDYDSDDDLEDYEDYDSDDEIEDYENNDSDDEIEDYENNDSDDDDVEDYENNDSDDDADIEDYENNDDEIEDYENDDDDSDNKDNENKDDKNKNVEEYAVYDNIKDSQADHKNIVGVMLNTIFTLIIVYFFYYILYNIANNPELKNQFQKLVTPSELNNFMNNNPNFKISSYCKMIFYTLFGVCVILSIIMIFFLILFFTNKSRYLIISSTTLLSFINIFIVCVYISMFGYFIYRLKSSIYDINIKDYDLTTIDIWEYIKGNFSNKYTNLNNMNGGNIGELPPNNESIKENNDNNKNNISLLDNLDNLIDSLNFKWVYIFLFFVLISIIILTSLLNIANVKYNVSDKVKYLVQTSVSMNRFIIGIFYSIFFFILIFWNYGIFSIIKDNGGNIFKSKVTSYIENKNYKNILYNFITNSVVIMILIYITGYFNNITTHLLGKKKQSSYFYSSMQALFIIILIILFIYIIGGFYYLYTIFKKLFDDTSKIYTGFMVIIFILIFCFIISLPSIILSHQSNLENTKMPLVGLFSSYAVFGVLLFIWYKFLPRNNGI